MGLVSKEMIADLIINIINILILFFLTKALLYKPVKKFLTARRERMAQEAAALEAAKAEAEAEKTRYEALLTDAETEKAEMLRQAERDAQEKARAVLEQAGQQAKEALDKAAGEAQREKEKLLASAREDVADLAVDISAKILAREITDADNLAIARRFFEGPEAQA